MNREIKFSDMGEVANKPSLCNPKCKDCIVGASRIDGEVVILTYGMSAAYEVEEKFNFCPICGRRIKNARD